MTLGCGCRIRSRPQPFIPSPPDGASSSEAFMFRYHCSSLLVLGLIAFSASADEIKTISGKSVSGTLEKISDTEITLTGTAGPVKTTLAQTIELFLRPGKTMPTAESYVEAMMLDQSLLRATKATFTASEIQLDLTSGQSVKYPISALVYLVRGAQSADIQKQWASLMKVKTRDDRIFISNAGSLNPVNGTLGDIDAATQKIKFKTSVGTDIEPELAKLAGLHFVRTEVPSQPTLCKVVDLDGNELIASKLNSDGTKLNVTTPFGAKVALDLKVVSTIDFNFGKLIYLSDLDAKSPDAILLGGFNPLRKDANLDGDPIILQAKQYPKGLSMYAGADLEYNLAGKYKEFKAILGADSRIAEEGQGKVTVSIYCDKQKVLTKEVSTTAAAPIALNVKDVGTLRIVVSGANFTNYSGHATLANAHVSQ
jgi:hypothetical protein